MQVTNPSAASSADIESAAADWLARSDRGLDPVAQDALQRWLAADPRHAAAWSELQATWRTFDLPRHRGVAGQMIRKLTTRRRRRRTVLGSFAAIAACVIALTITHHWTGETQAAPDGNIVLLRPDRQPLSDGSVVVLNTGAQIEVHYSATRREVRLLRGEAYFEVVEDMSRPFVVATLAGNVRAVGTAFAVGLHPREVAVLVTEGTVAVERPATVAQSSVPVSAGNALVIPENVSSESILRVAPIPAAEIERRLAWRAPRLELSNAALVDVIAALNDENHVQLSIADPMLARLSLSGVVRADQAESFVHLLESHYGVRAESRDPGAIVLHRAD